MYQNRTQACILYWKHRKIWKIPEFDHQGSLGLPKVYENEHFLYCYCLIIACMGFLQVFRYKVSGNFVLCNWQLSHIDFVVPDKIGEFGKIISFQVNNYRKSILKSCGSDHRVKQYRATQIFKCAVVRAYQDESHIGSILLTLYFHPADCTTKRPLPFSGYRKRRMNRKYFRMGKKKIAPGVYLSKRTGIYYQNYN